MHAKNADDSLAPRCELDDNLAVANARIWRERAGGRMRAVLKSDGYGWGARRLARVLENEVEGFYILDPAEAHALSGASSRPLFLLGFCPERQLKKMLERGVTPNISTLAELDAVLDFARAGTVTVRVGLAPAVSWNGVLPEHTQIFADRLAAERRIRVELWTHFTSIENQVHELSAFNRFAATFRSAGVNIAGIDTANSAALARGIRDESGAARIGIGLFGAFCSQVPELRCALRLNAQIVARRESRDDLRIGYARLRPTPGRFVETLRIGYGDGWPRGLVGKKIILPEGEAWIAGTGMQHTVLTHDLPPQGHRTLIHSATDIVSLCAATALSAHELVLALGVRADRTLTH
jgi:alanine racemase